MKIADFVVRIEAPKGADPPQLQIDSPAGQECCSLHLDLQEIEDLLPRLSLWISRGPEAIRDLKPLEGQGKGWNPKEIGARLYQALFGGAAGRFLDRSLGQLQGESRLRIKIRFAPEQSAAVRIARLPWELLYDGKDFLHRGDQKYLLTRFLEVPEFVKPLKVSLPLRILVVVANPRFAPALDVGGERMLIEQAWRKLRKNGQIEVSLLENPTLDELRDEIGRHQSHVLHFIGHGSFDPVSGEGTLLLKNGEDEGQISGDALAAHLRIFDHLRLAVLNACKSAEIHGTHPFGGVGSALVRAGLPAVVAMQFPISDAAALAFSDRFYTRLAEGDPVDVSTAEGRLGIYHKLPKSFEWATPVLYLRAPDGVLFEIESVAKYGRAERLASWKVGRWAVGRWLLLLLCVGSHVYSLLSTAFLLACLSGLDNGDLRLGMAAALPTVATIPLGLRCEKALPVSRWKLRAAAALMAFALAALAIALFLDSSQSL